MTSNHLLLHRLAELMLEHEQHILLVDLLFDDEQIGDFVKSIQIDSPYQQMVLEGVLTESIRVEKLYVSFTVEGYFHYVLGEVIYNLTKGKSPEALRQIIEENKLNGAKEGVEQCLIRDVLLDDLTRLMWLIDAGEEMLELCVIPLLYSFKIQGVENTIQKLLVNPTENDWIIIQIIHDKLFQSENHNLRNELTQNLIDLNLDFNKIYFEIISSGISEFEKNKMLILLDKIETSDFILNSKICFNIAYCYEKLNDSKKSLNYYQKSYSLRDTNDIDFKAKLYQKIAWSYYILNDFANALEYNKKGLEIRRKLYGEINEYVAHSLNDLGLVYDAMGDVNSGIEYIEKAIVILSKVLGENIIDIGTSYYNLGNLFYSKNDINLAFSKIDKAIKIYNKLLGDNHVNLAHFYYLSGLIMLNKHKYYESIEYLNKALTVTLNYLGEFDIGIAYTYNALGRAYKNLEKHEIAIVNFQKGFKIEQTYDYIFNIAECFEALNQPIEALDYYIQSAEIRKEDIGVEEDATQEVIANAKRLAKELGKEDALPEWMK
jgi:tetratricopeptide (TPR) repeat protein